jgi:FMN phosphatase YigB (HAD superfamily)
MCAPSGKVAALFIDVDGTIVECQPNFDAAIKRFGFLMALLGFDKKRAIAVLRETELANAKTQGFERDRFPRSIVTAYSTLCKERKIRRRQEIIAICEDIGNSPYFREPKLFPNVAAVLGRAHHNFMLIAVTIGNREVQKHKIRQGGLDPVFDRIIITPTDNKVDRVREAMRDLNIDPEFSAFIGNSPKSDGACLEVTNFIFLPLEKGWAFDNAPLPTSSVHQLFKATDWRDAEEGGIERLIRQRETALLDQKAKALDPSQS